MIILHREHILLQFAHTAKNVFYQVNCRGGSLCPPGKQINTNWERDRRINTIINENFKSVKIDKYVIIPNHIHLIVIIEYLNLDEEQTGGRGTPPLHDVIGKLKSYTTNKYDGVLWQRSYHDHIIRGEKDYQKIWEYIDTNISNWEKDCFYDD